MAVVNWTANFSAAIQDTAAAGFREVHIQQDGGPLQKEKKVPIVDAPYGIGRGLMLELQEGQKRLEVLPPAHEFVEGDTCYFRVDFALDASYRLDRTPDWGPIINQVHHEGEDGSPPIEFQARNNILLLSGGDPTFGPSRYEQLFDSGASNVEVGVKYKLVYSVSFSGVAQKSVINVWLDDVHVLVDYRSPCPTIYPNERYSYWKGATFYTGVGNAPGVLYQTAHRMGSSLNDVL